MCGIAGMIDLGGRRPAPRGVGPAMARSGICPLYYTTVRHDGDDWLLFASEVKGLLASGLVEPRSDLRGLNHIFTFFAMPGPVTVFAGVTLLVHGRYLHFKLGNTTPPE